MQLAKDGPNIKYMVAAGVVFGNQYAYFDIDRAFDAVYLADLARKVALVGGRVRGSKMKVDIELCAGHIISIEHVRQVNQAQALKGIDAHVDYLNIGVVAPGCHDSFNGPLGLTFNCKYGRGAKFEWSITKEESFRVPSLDTPSGLFSRQFNCIDDVEFDGKMTVGGAMR